jgi:hypothetical protein
MVAQYPYSLYRKQIVSSKDENGNIQSTSTMSLISACRNETKSASTIYTEDSKEYTSRSVVYLPLGQTQILKEGDEIQVKDGSIVRIEGQILKVHYGQLNVKIWL